MSQTSCRDEALNEPASVLVDVSDIFNFFLLGEGEGGVRGAGRGGSTFLKGKSQEGCLQEGEGPRSREGVCGELGNCRGGRGKYFLDERQITHLICARLKYDLYDFF